MYLFDTDAISQVIKRSPSIPFIRKLASTDIEKQFTTTITVKVPGLKIEDWIHGKNEG